MKFARTNLIRLLAVVVACGNFFIPWSATLPAQAAALNFSGTPKTAAMVLPVLFEKNQGQAPADVAFISRGRGWAAGFKADQTLFSFKAGTQSANVAMQFVGANGKLTLAGEGIQSASTSYLFGQDQNKWVQGAANYSAIRYNDIYPGIDLRYYGKDGSLEYDYEVAPGADPAKIVSEIKGAASLAFVNSDLVIGTAAGPVTLRAPIAYQEKNGVRTAVEAAYSTNGNQLSFFLGAYDKTLPLVIDPVLAYSTFIGGNGPEAIFDVTADSLGNLYVVGTTVSSVFGSAYFMPPIAMDPNPINNQDAAFIVKLNPTGDTVLYAIVFGGTPAGGGGSQARGVAVDAANNAYVSGVTSQTDFPVTSGVVQGTLGGGVGQINDGFIVKINSTGNGFAASSFLGGSGQDWPTGLHLDGNGNIYVAGYTESTDFPVTAGAYQTSFGEVLSESSAMFVAKLNSSVTTLSYSTYIRPENNEAIQAFKVDAAGHVYLTGWQSTAAPQVITPFLIRLNAAGTALDYNLTLGGPLMHPNNLAIDNQESAYVVGDTSCADLTTTVGVFQPTCASDGDAFIVKYNSSGTLVYASYLGGSNADNARSVGVDSDDNAYIGGETASSNFPVVNPPAGMSKNNTTAYDAFMTKVVPDGSAIEYSTYFGGDLDERATDIFLDPSNNVIVSGDTSSSNFPTTTGTVWSAAQGGGDGFMVKFGASDSHTAPANSTATVHIEPYISGEAGVEGTIDNNTPGSSGATITIERLGLAPKGHTTFDIGGSLVDIKVSGANAADEATVSVYYGDTVTGNNENNLTLMYTDSQGHQKAVKTKGNGNPGKDKTNNKKGTKSGGTIGVIFDSDSKPTIMELTGTVFASTNTVPGNIDLVKIEVNDWALDAGKKTTLQGYLDGALSALAVGQNSTAVSRMNSFKSRVNGYVADGSTTAYVVASALDSATTIIANIPAFTPGGDAWNEAKDIINGLIPQIAPLSIMPASEKSYVRGKLYNALSALAVGNQGSIYINGSAMERMNSFKTRINSDISRGWVTVAEATPLKAQAQAAMDIISANPPLPGRIQ